MLGNCECNWLSIYYAVNIWETLDHLRPQYVRNLSATGLEVLPANWSITGRWTDSSIPGHDVIEPAADFRDWMLPRNKIHFKLQYHIVVIKIELNYCYINHKFPKVYIRGRTWIVWNTHLVWFSFGPKLILIRFRFHVSSVLCTYQRNWKFLGHVSDCQLLRIDVFIYLLKLKQTRLADDYCSVRSRTWTVQPASKPCPRRPPNTGLREEAIELCSYIVNTLKAETCRNRDFIRDNIRKTWVAVKIYMKWLWTMNYCSDSLTETTMPII